MVGFWHRLGTKGKALYSATLSPPCSSPLTLPHIWVPTQTSHRPLSSGFHPVKTGATGQTRSAAEIMSGKPIAKDINLRVAAEISRMKAAIGRLPGLAVVLVGYREDSHAYVHMKLKACNEVGIETSFVQLPQDCTQDRLIDVVSSFNSNPSVHGIIVQLPLPQHLDEETIINFVSPEKDVDGFHPLNMGNLALRGREPLFIPCTPKACIELLLRYRVEITGKNAVVIGRSKVAGLSTSFLLQRHHATVSTLHSFTNNPEQITRRADIVVSDVGIPNIVGCDWLMPGAVVVDMGTNSVKHQFVLAYGQILYCMDPNSPRGFRTTGDVCYEEAIKVVSAITPVPGGVGPVVISMLLCNTLDSAKRAYGFT